MTGSNCKARKRAPRLPGHLLSRDSFTTSPGSPERASERPCSPTSSVETSSVLDLDDRLSDVSYMGTRTGFTRLTQSPLMHSAIVQGTAPKARVKNTAVNPLLPTIKSVLGLGGPPAVLQQEDSNLRTSRSRSCASGFRCSSTSFPVRDSASQDYSGGIRGATVPAALQRGALFSEGDLVWYHHPSGPWIAGKLTSVLRSCGQPQYIVTTDEDGVKRHAMQEDIQLRTSVVAPKPSAIPAERQCVGRKSGHPKAHSVERTEQVGSRSHRHASHSIRHSQAHPSCHEAASPKVPQADKQTCYSQLDEPDESGRDSPGAVHTECSGSGEAGATAEGAAAAPEKQQAVDPLSIPVWQNTCAPVEAPRAASSRSLLPPDISDTGATARMTPSASNRSLALTAKDSQTHAAALPPLCPSRDHSSSSSRLLSATGSSRAFASEPGEPRSFPLLTPPSETPLEAARTLLEGTDAFSFGGVEHGGTLFAPDMTPPPRTASFGTNLHLAGAASAGTEAMFTPSLDTPLTDGVRTNGTGGGTGAVAAKAPAVHSRSLSGLLRACVVDTFGLGGAAADRSRAQSAAGSGSAVAAEKADAGSAGAGRPPAESPDLFMPMPPTGEVHSSVAGLPAASDPNDNLSFGAGQDPLARPVRF